jgi:large subunit ribosomal protein L10
MNRTEKSRVVDDVRDRIVKASLVVVVQQSGLSVAEAGVLRRRMRDAGSEFRVVKNTLLRLAVKGTPLEGLTPLFKGPTALAISDDPITAAKISVKFSEENAKLFIAGGCMDGQTMNAASIKALAKLPSLNELRATLAALVVAPATKIAILVKEPAARIARVLAARH